MIHILVSTAELEGRPGCQENPLCDGRFGLDGDTTRQDRQHDDWIRKGAGTHCLKLHGYRVSI